MDCASKRSTFTVLIDRTVKLNLHLVRWSVSAEILQSIYVRNMLFADPHYLDLVARKPVLGFGPSKTQPACSATEAF